MDKPATILFKYASRSRRNNFFRGLDSIYDNLADNENFHVLCEFDLDDTVMNNNSVISKISEYKNIIYNFGNSKTKIEAINANLENASYFDILVCMSDDQIFTVKEFDDIIRNNFNGDYSLLLHLPDGSDAGYKIPTMHIVGVDYFKRTCNIYHPNFISVMSDNYEKLIAKKRGKYKYVGALIYEHLHYRWGKAQMRRCRWLG